MKTIHPVTAMLCTLMVASLVSGAAAAQEPTITRAKGFVLNRFEPAPPGSQWSFIDVLQYQGQRRIVAGMILDMAHKPLVLYGPESSETGLVTNQFYMHLASSLLLGDLFRVALDIPLLLYQDGSSFYLEEMEYVGPRGIATGDIRLSGDVCFFRSKTGRFRAGGGLYTYVPIGSRDAYASDGAFRLTPYAGVAGEIGRFFTYGGRLGVDIRTRTGDFAGAPMGSGILLEVGAGFHALERKIFAGAELLAATGLGKDAYFAKLTSPIELLLSGRVRLPKDLQAGLSVGAGLTRAFGVPRFRWLAVVEWRHGI